MFTTTFRALSCCTTTSRIHNIARIPLETNTDIIHSILPHFWQTNTFNIDYLQRYAILNRLDTSTAKKIFSGLVYRLEIISRKPIVNRSISKVDIWLLLKFNLNLPSMDLMSFQPSFGILYSDTSLSSDDEELQDGYWSKHSLMYAVTLNFIKMQLYELY